jgi:hypothetical protein
MRLVILFFPQKSALNFTPSTLIITKTVKKCFICQFLFLRHLCNHENFFLISPCFIKIHLVIFINKFLYVFVYISVAYFFLNPIQPVCKPNSPVISISLSYKSIPISQIYIIFKIRITTVFICFPLFLVFNIFL